MTFNESHPEIENGKSGRQVLFIIGSISVLMVESNVPVSVGL